MSDTTLRDLLARGYEGHASEIKSGDAFAARYHDRVASKVRRRRAVRHTAIAAATFASVAVATVGAQAAIRAFDGDSVDPVVAPPSWTPTPSPSPTEALEETPDEEEPSRARGTYVPPLPTGEAPGVVTEDTVLRLVPNATPPTALGVPLENVACGAPVAGTYVDPIFDQASARILKPDTLYPTFLDPAYVTEEGDVLLGLWKGADGEVDRSYLAPSGDFRVAVSLLSKALADAWQWDPAAGFFTGGIEVSYEVVTRQGVVIEEEDFGLGTTDTIDLAYGAVLASDGVIVGHTDYLASFDELTMTINEVSATDGITEVVYDFGVGPLAHVNWCGERPAGPLDAYAVVGVRPFAQVGFIYSFIWAGQVEYL